MDTTNQVRKVLAHHPSHADVVPPCFSASATEATRLLRIVEATKRVGVCKAWVYNLIRSDNFPKPIKLGSASVWIEIEVQGWIANKVDEQRRVA